MTQPHLAEINIARTLASLEDPLMAGFVAQLDAINALAEASSGFVWRLKSDDGGSSSYIRALDDERTIINMSVWESVDALYAYAYKSGHMNVFRDRKKWFEPLPAPQLAMWWIPAGHIPTVDEGLERLELLKRLGPTEEAFTFRSHLSLLPSARGEGAEGG